MHLPLLPECCLSSCVTIRQPGNRQTRGSHRQTQPKSLAGKRSGLMQSYGEDPNFTREVAFGASHYHMGSLALGWAVWLGTESSHGVGLLCLCRKTGGRRPCSQHELAGMRQLVGLRQEGRTCTKKSEAVGQTVMRGEATCVWFYLFLKSRKGFEHLIRFACQMSPRKAEIKNKVSAGRRSLHMAVWEQVVKLNREIPAPGNKELAALSWRGHPQLYRTSTNETTNPGHLGLTIDSTVKQMIDQFANKRKQPTTPIDWRDRGTRSENVAC